MNIFIDIETIPNQKPGAKEAFIQDSINNFKAPSTLTKTQAAADLGLTDKNEIKFTSADDMKARWEKEMAPNLAESVGEENWRRTALDGAQGQIFSIAWAVENGPIQCLHNEYIDKYKETSDRILLTNFYLELNEALSGRPPFFIGQNVADFDLRFMFRRSVILGVKPPFKLPHAGRHGSDFYDLQQEWGGFKARISLDSMCKALGIEGKPDDIDGSKVWTYIESGDYEKVIEYNKYDVEQTRKVYNKFNFIKDDLCF